jgi:hypothetical protein
VGISKQPPAHDVPRANRAEENIIISVVEAFRAPGCMRSTDCPDPSFRHQCSGQGHPNGTLNQLAAVPGSKNEDSPFASQVCGLALPT